MFVFESSQQIKSTNENIFRMYSSNELKWHTYLCAGGWNEKKYFFFKYSSFLYVLAYIQEVHTGGLIGDLPREVEGCWDKKRS